ncbi:MAG: twitching motility protein PilT [Roseiflexaceae bacterium]|nr:twitching motility protein PilT [Roseiflexaceae bacterium]
MKVSFNFLVRIIGMIVLAWVGQQVGIALSDQPPSTTQELAIQLLTLAGAGLGLLTTHHWTITPIQRSYAYARSISIEDLVALSMGALLGLFFALLLAIPLGYLPSPLGQFLPLSAALLLGYGGAQLMLGRRKELVEVLRSSRAPSFVVPPQLLDALGQQRRYLLDTSAIIDGRIAQVGESGFLDGKLIVPRFVLNELQLLADSSDELRRNKGRRGLDILNDMQKAGDIPVEIIDSELNSGEPVDDRLIALANQQRCPLITNDFNLGRVAKLQGVQVLNLNQLADAVRAPVIPGQDIQVTIRDTGREREQGISFLADGTMVVVEDARKLVGREVSATVTRIHQTQTGRIIFAHMAGNGKR